MSKEVLRRVDEIDVELSEEVKNDLEAVKKAVRERDNSKFKKVDPDSL